jgi:hypothetical protein
MLHVDVGSSCWYSMGRLVYSRKQNVSMVPVYY